MMDGNRIHAPKESLSFSKKLCFLLLFLTIFIAPNSKAIAALPPHFDVVVLFPPNDLQISLKSRDLPEPISAEMTLTLWEGEFVFPLLPVMKNNESLDGLSLLVSYENRRFEIPLTNMDEVLKAGGLITLNIKKQSYVPGSPFGYKTVLMIARTILTMLPVTLLFCLFAYRKRELWTFFVVYNFLSILLLNFFIVTPDDNEICAGFILALSLFINPIIESYFIKKLVKEEVPRKVSFLFSSNILKFVIGLFLWWKFPM